MAHLLFTITGQSLIRLDTFKPVEKSYNYLKAHFEYLSDDWKDKTVTGVFTKDEITRYSVVDENGDCIVPWEVLSSEGKMKVSAFCGNRITTNSVDVYIYGSGFEEGTLDVDQPSPSMYDEMQDYFATVRNEVQENREWVEEQVEDLKHINGGTHDSSDWLPEGEVNENDEQNTTIQFRHGPTNALTDELIEKMRPGEAYIGSSPTSVTVKADDGAHDSLITKTTYDLLLEKVGKLEEDLNGMNEDLYKDDVGLFAQLTSVRDDVQTCFNDADLSEDGLLTFLHNGVILKANMGPFAGGGGGGGGAAYSKITIDNRNEGEWSSIAVREGESVTYKAYVTSVDSDTGESTGDMTYVLYRGITVVERGTLKQGYHDFKLDDYINNGTNDFRLSVTDSNGSNRSRVWSVTVVAITITGEFNNNQVRTSAFDLTVRTSGTGTRSVYCRIDGDDETMQVKRNVVGNNKSSTFTIDNLPHGVHSIEVWADTTYSGLTVESESIYYEVPFADGVTDQDLIASSFKGEEVDQYSNLVIPYFVYNKDSYYSDVEIYVNNKLVSDPTVGRTEVEFTYRPIETGALNILIRSGNARKEFNLTVADSGMNVKAETEGLLLHLSSMSRSNNEKNPAVWEYDNGFNTITCDFSGFNFGANDGWHVDSNGSTALRLVGDDRLTINFEPFSSNLEENGFTIELEVITHSVLDPNAKVINCWKGDNEPGMYLTANEFLFKSQKTSVKTNFKDGEHITLVANVSSNAVTAGRLIKTYINGEIGPTAQYDTSDNFVQSPNGGGDNSRPKIVIGSNDCGIDIYKIRVYKNALSDDAVENNFIADTPDLDTMIERYQRNDIRDEYGNIVLSKLPNDLPYFIFYVPELVKTAYDNFGNRLPQTWDPIADLPRYKGDKKTVRCLFHHPQIPRLCYTAEGVQVDVQGTSSQNYFRKNYKLKFKEGFKLTDTGETVSKIAIRDNSVPVSTFCFKADVASSEGANNVLLVRLYEEFCRSFFLTAPQKAELAKPAEERLDIRQGIDGFPMVVFWAEDETSPIHFLGKYNYNNDKSTTDVFGFAVGDQSIEVRNNTSGRCLFQDGVAMDWGTTPEDKKKIYSGPLPVPTSTDSNYKGDFEFRYPDGDDIDWDDLEQFERFEAMVDWVRSTDVVTPFLSDVEKAKIEYVGNWMTDEQQAQVDAVTLSASRIAEIDAMTEAELLSAERVTEIDAMTPDQLLTTERLIEINEMTVEELLTSSRIAEIDAMDIEDGDKEDMKEEEAEEAREVIRQSEAVAARAALKNVDAAKQALKDEELEAAKEALMAPWKEAFISARETKFANEFEDYFDLDAMAFYYVFTEVFLLSDSRAKNAFWTHMGDGKWFSLPYDMDTAIGIDNQGAISYSPWLEDTDHVGGGDVFTGQKSTLWVNFRKMFAAKISEVYIKLINDKLLTYDKIINTFAAHQSVYPIDLVNEDANFKYFAPLLKPEPNDTSGRLISTAMYLKMCLGTKREHTKWWIGERIPFLDSKFNVGSAASEFIQFRAYEKADITLTTYKTVYPRILIGSREFFPNGAIEPVKVAGMTTVTIPVEISNLNNTESKVYSASAIKDINLYAVKPDTIDVSAAVNLESLRVGSSEPGYENLNIGSKQGDKVTVGDLSHLKIFDISNCPNCNYGIDLSGCTAIETILAEGSAVTGFSLPNGGQLRTMLLGNNINSLIIKNHKGLSYQGEGADDPERGEFKIGTWDNIGILDLENIYDKDDAMSVPFVNMQQVHNMVPASAAMHLVGFEWSATSVQEVNAWLAEIDTHEDVNENGGRIANSSAHVECTIHVPSITGAQYKAIRDAHPGVTITYDSISAQVTFLNDADEGWTPVTVTVEGAGDAEYPSTAPTPTKEATAEASYVFAGWSTRRNQTEPDEDALKHVEIDRTLYAVFRVAAQFYQVSFVNDDYTMQSYSVEYGAHPTYAGDTPTDITGRDFLGWTMNDGDDIITDLSTVTITGPTVFHAAFRTTHNVRLMNKTRVFQTFPNISYGDTISYTGQNPSDPDGSGAPFLGWYTLDDPNTIITDLSSVVITKTIDFYAKYEDTYTVTFKKYATDTSYLYQAEKVIRGNDANYMGPTVVGDHGEEFLGWNPSNLNVTEDRVCVAIFEETYTVTFMINNQVYDTKQYIKSGENSPLPADPVLANMRFREWRPAPVNVTNNMTVNAVFDQTYTAYFYKDTQSEPIYTQDGLIVGETPEFSGKYPTGDYNAAFVRWDPEVGPITGDTYYYAEYEPRYTVTFYNDTSKSKTYHIERGVAPHGSVTYPSSAETPSKSGAEWLGWDKDTSDVTGNMEVFAVFRGLNTVTFVNDTTVLYSDSNVGTGMAPTYGGETPVDETYGGTFLGWYKGNDTTLITDLSTVTITENTVFHAVFSTAYVVTFYKDDTDTEPYEVVKGITPNGTCTPTKASPTKSGYEFAGWDRDLTNITGNISVYANWTKLYTVRYMVDGSAVQSSNTVHRNETYPFTSTTPSKSGYRFDGWYVSTDANQTLIDPSTVYITVDTDFVAKFTQVHTVRFMDGTTVLQTVNDVPHGGDATFTQPTPTKDGFKFNGWNPAPTNITANTDCQVVWKEDAGFDDAAYGITWNYATNTSKATRVGLSANFEDPTPATSVDASGSSPFDTIAPWKDMKVYNVVDGNLIEKGESGFSFTDNDTVVYIPEFYIKSVPNTTGKKLTLAISPTPMEGYTKHPGSGRYIGRYHTSGSASAVFSKSGVSPLVNVNQTNFRSYQSAKGDGWSMMDYATWSALQWLYLIEFADFDSQTTLGKGWNTGSVGAMGGTDAAIYHTLQATGAHNMYRWIEDPFSNVYDWIDGFIGSTSAVYLGTNGNYDGTTATLTKVGNLKLPSSNYITSFAIDEDFPWALIPATSQSSEGYVHDKVYSSNNEYPAYVGGVCNDGALYGLFCLAAYSAASDQYGSLGSRLQRVSA